MSAVTLEARQRNDGALEKLSHAEGLAFVGYLRAELSRSEEIKRALKMLFPGGGKGVRKGQSKEPHTGGGADCKSIS